MKNRITYQESRYLKHIAKENNDIKVSIEIRDGFPYVNIRDFQFVNFNQAIQYLQHDSNNLVRS